MYKRKIYTKDKSTKEKYFKIHEFIIQKQVKQKNFKIQENKYTYDTKQLVL